MTKRPQNLFFLDSSTMLRFLITYIEEGVVRSEEEKLMLNMFYYSFYKDYPEKEGLASIKEGVQQVLSNVDFKNEILAILSYRYESLETLEIENDFPFPSPLKVHCNYSTTQILAALGYYNKK